MGTRRRFLKLTGAGAAIVCTQVRHACAFDSTLKTEVVRARDLGILADGRTDVTYALYRALNSGHVIDGEGGAFAVTGELAAGSRFKGLMNVILVQQKPEIKSVRTLSIRAAENFLLSNVSIRRQGNGSEEDDIRMLDKTGGLFLSYCKNFKCEDINVSGGGIGTGIAFIYCENFEATSLSANDLWYNLANHPADDAIQGLFFGRCKSFILKMPRCHDIGGSDRRTSTHDNNRGIALSGCDMFEIHHLNVENVGQGLDVSGGAPGNSNFKIREGVAVNCFSWGFKFANSAQFGFINNATARRCGIGGFVVSGPGDAQVPPSKNIEFEKCLAEDILGNYIKSMTSFGFGVIRPKQQHIAYPRNIIFRDCKAVNIDKLGRMKYGFRNDIPAISTEGNPNIVENCKASGFTDEAFFGFD